MPYDAASREHRLASGPEAIWDELRDTARDLGLPFLDRRSPPHETGAGLVGHLGSRSTTGRGPGTAPAGLPGPVASQHRLVGDVERLRYASGHDEVAPRPAGRRPARGRWPSMRGTTPRARRRATWLPRTLLRPASVTRT